MSIDKRIENDFKYHKVGPEQVTVMTNLREQILALAKQIVKVVPNGREQASALTRLEEVMFHANAGISRAEPVELPSTKIINVFEAVPTHLNYAVRYVIDGEQNFHDLDIPAFAIHHGNAKQWVTEQLISKYGLNIEVRYI